MAHVIPNTNTEIDQSIANGLVAMIEGQSYVTAGKKNATTLGTQATAEGRNTTASGNYSHAEGYMTIASGANAHAEGYKTEANKLYSHAEGYQTTASSSSAHAEGGDTVASGGYSHAEGSDSTASGDYSHAEGFSSEATGFYSHAEGYDTTSSNHATHAEGYSTTASTHYAHSEGAFTTASGQASHAEGRANTASGMWSHAEGFHTEANHRSQHVFGEYNELDPSAADATEKGNYIEIVGNGTDSTPRSNARTLDWEGNEVLSGKLTLGKHGTDPMDVATVGEALNAYATDNASGSIASFSDGADNIPMKSFVCSIDPIQNLNGQSAPYPAGGAKNKLNPTGESGTTSGIITTKNSDGSYTVTGGNTYSSAVAILAGEWQATAGVTYTLNGCPSGGSNNSYRLDIRTSPTTPYQGTPVDTGSGVDITPSADATLYVYMRFAIGYNISGSLSFKPMIRLATEADATFAPYSNVCPISGHSGVNAVVAGQNLVDGLTWTNDRYYNDSGVLTGSAQTKAMETYIPVSPSTLYAFRWGNNNPTARLRVHEYDSSKNWLRQKYSALVGDGTIVVDVSTSADAAYIRFSLAKSATDIIVGAGTTYPVTFVDGSTPLTVYKGYVDIVSGVLTVTSATISYASSDGFNEHSSNRWYKGGGLPSGMDSANRAQSISNQAKYQDSPNTYGALFAYGGSGIYIAKLVSTETFSDFSSRLTANPFQVVYPLATPQTYNLTPTEVLSLLGINNCFHDGNGNTAVTYRADTKLYIDKRLNA